MNRYLMLGALIVVLVLVGVFYVKPQWEKYNPKPVVYYLCTECQLQFESDQTAVEKAKCTKCGKVGPPAVIVMPMAMPGMSGMPAPAGN